MKLMQQSRQVNVYLTQSDIQKVQKYLADRHFLFVEDEILESPTPAYVDYLLAYPQTADYFCFPEVKLDYLQFVSEGIQKYRIKGIRTEVVNFDMLGRYDELFRVRFYYCPYYFENHEKKYKNPAFGLHVERFFRWLRSQFKRVPDMPTFYYNPAFPPKEWF